MKAGLMGDKQTGYSIESEVRRTKFWLLGFAPLLIGFLVYKAIAVYIGGIVCAYVAFTFVLIE